MNAEKLLWNWQMGRDLVQKKAEERWGAGVVEQVSLDLQKEFPGEKGFSAANLWFMKKWYLYYATDEATKKLEQVVREMHLPYYQDIIKLKQAVREIETENLYQSGREIPHQHEAEFPLVTGDSPLSHRNSHIEKYCHCLLRAPNGLFYGRQVMDIR